MEYQIQIVQASIDYIEANLMENIELEKIAEAAHISLPHLYRMFSLLTGMTIKEYIRLRRMTKAVLELRFSSAPIIDIAVKYGFSTQESFMRTFGRLLGINPGEYRKINSPLMLLDKKDILEDFIHKAAHESINEGIVENLDINIYLIYKPAHKWVAKLNRENWNDFYEECHKQGIMKLIDNLPSDMRYGGGFIIVEGSKDRIVSYGKEVAEDFNGEIPDFCEVFDIPAAKYMVFNHPPYAIECHGSVINSVFGAINKFKPEDLGFKWAEQGLPIYNDDDKFGFTVMRPVIELV